MDPHTGHDKSNYNREGGKYYLDFFLINEQNYLKIKKKIIKYYCFIKCNFFIKKYFHKIHLNTFSQIFVNKISHDRSNEIFLALRAKRACVRACKKLHSMLALLLHYSEVVNIQPRAAFHSHYVNSWLCCRVHSRRVANKFLSIFVAVLHFEWKFL